MKFGFIPTEGGSFFKEALEESIYGESLGFDPVGNKKTDRTQKQANVDIYQRETQSILLNQRHQFEYERMQRQGDSDLTIGRKRLTDLQKEKDPLSIYEEAKRIHALEKGQSLERADYHYSQSEARLAKAESSMNEAKNARRAFGRLDAGSKARLISLRDQYHKMGSTAGMRPEDIDALFNYKMLNEDEERKINAQGDQEAEQAGVGKGAESKLDYARERAAEDRKAGDAAKNEKTSITEDFLAGLAQQIVDAIEKKRNEERPKSPPPEKPPQSKEAESNKDTMSRNIPDAWMSS